MNAIENQVKELVKTELESANSKFPLFNSPHEGYAVILEEIDECELEMKRLRMQQMDFWYSVKANDLVSRETFLKNMYTIAVNLAIEAIQVAAMCDKFGISFTFGYVDRCVCCGEIVPEGRYICFNCEK